MVYANIDLDLDGQAVLHYLFRRGLKKFDRFCDKLNYFVEELINLTNSDFGHRLRIMEDERKCQQIDNLIAFMERY